VAFSIKFTRKINIDVGNNDKLENFSGFFDKTVSPEKCDKPQISSKQGWQKTCGFARQELSDIGSIGLQ